MRLNSHVDKSTTSAADQDPLPPAPRRRSLLLARPSLERWPVGVRSALAFGLPALVLVGAGYHREALLVTLGAFAVMYGEQRPYRVRWRVVLLAGAALFVASMIGAVLGDRLSGLWEPGTKTDDFIEVAALSLVGLIAVFVVTANRSGPPGAFFFVLVCSVATQVSRAGLSIAAVAVCCAVGVVSALVVSMSGVLLDKQAPQRAAVESAVRSIDDYVAVRERADPAGPARHAAAAALHSAWAMLYDAGHAQRLPPDELVQTLLVAHRRFVGVDPAEELDDDGVETGTPTPLGPPESRARLLCSLTFRSHASTSALRVMVAAGVAGGISVLVGLGRPDWAVITAVLVLHQGPDRVVGTVRGFHRLGGTVIGLALFALIYQFAPAGAVLVLVLMALMFLVDVAMARNYGIAVIAVTPLALLIGGAGASGGSIAVPMRDRLVETIIGVAIALATLWLVVPHAHRRDLRWTETRVAAAAEALLLELRRQPPNALEALRLRRDLQFELVISRSSGVQAVRNEPEWTGSVWPTHVELSRNCYELLVSCWDTPPGDLLADPDGWGERIHRAGLS